MLSSALEQGRHVRSQSLPGGAFILGKKVQRRLIADGSEVGIAPPMRSYLPLLLLYRGVVLLDERAIIFQIGSQPVQRQTAEYAGDLVGRGGRRFDDPALAEILTRR